MTFNLFSISIYKNLRDSPFPNPKLQRNAYKNLWTWNVECYLILSDLLTSFFEKKESKRHYGFISKSVVFPLYKLVELSL